MCNTNLRHLPRLFHNVTRQLVCVLLLTVFALAQSGDRDARAAQWNGYKLPDGEFTRFVDRQKGFSFWHPANWKHRTLPNGVNLFQADQNAANLLAMTEDIPEGYGIANYASSYLRSVRDQSVVEESVIVRRVMMSGLEWRELYYDADKQGAQFHQTAWMTAVGPRVYIFVLTTRPGEVQQGDAVLKRAVMTARIAAAGHWDEEFETLRAKFAASVNPVAGRETVAASIAEDLRAARLSFDAAAGRLTQLFNQSPDAAFDVATDAEAHIRAAAITALGKARLNQTAEIDALLWALNDKDVFASGAAASALAARGQAGLQAVKGKLPALAENPAALVRAGVAFSSNEGGEEISRELIATLLNSDSSQQHLAAMLLALALPHFDAPLPFSKLIASSQAGQAADGSLWNATVAVMQKHLHGQTAAGVTAELTKLLGGDQEWWAAQALGEIAPPETAALLERRIALIDTRLEALGKKAKPATGKSKASRGKRSGKPPRIEVVGTIPSSEIVWVGDPKLKPEDVRLAMARGQIETALRKINFRARWNKAKTEAERRAARTEFNKNNWDLNDWANSVTSPINTQSPPPSIDSAKLANAPTTGETIFPKHSISYVMAPKFATTLERLDAALAGVQMATVRDQMTFALILKLLKTNLADKTGVSTTGDVNKALGIDLASPISLATWMGQATGETNSTRSAIALRVTDRARLERLLATYQEELGDLNSFATATAALSRFAGLIPAAVPVIFATLASGEARSAISGRFSLPRVRAAESSKSSLKPFAWVRQEKIGTLTATVFEKPMILASGGAAWETIYLAYLGETAIIASSQAALADTLRTAAGEPAIAQSAGFAKARGEQTNGSEIVFFSDLPGLFRSFDTDGELNKDNMFNPLLKAFGAESGALRLSPTSWETVFNLALADNQFTGSFKPFKVDQLTAPRELLPNSTILYAAATVDPPKLMDTIKKLVAESPSPGSSATVSSSPTKEIERSLENEIVPNMQGEIAAAILSLKPLFDSGEMPAMVFAARLKNKSPASALRAGKLFAKLKRVENMTALGSPVVALGASGGDDDDAPFAVVTDDYFILADSAETLKLLDSKERFADSRDFVRSLQNVPDNVALFATYNLEAAFNETAGTLGKGESQQMLPFISALVHAFHSQRAFVTLQPDGLRGHLAVSFDREGRYTIGDLAARSSDFDVANAIIPTKGLSIVQSPRVEAITLRITANRPGVAPRVRDDLAKFAWQKIEAFRNEGNDSTIVVTTASRHIPEKLTIKLPVASVAGDEFAEYLRPTARINSLAPEIVALAKQIAGDDKDAHSVAHKIGDWTYKNLKWKKVQSDTVETLASREADCLEHSELYVALARALGLPARVVTGAALSAGSFGAHAWVEVYLGKWVELDPTWGLMEHVDATHLRFDGDAFTSYAMLNQLELEIIGAQRTVADFQRDPLRLAKEFSLNKETRGLAFDLPLTVEQSLGSAVWDKLDEKQRAAVIKAFEQTVREMWQTWRAEMPEPVRVLRNETKGNRRVLTLLRGEALLRLTLASRDGAWFIVEHEVVDDALAEFADALKGALRPETRRGRIYEIPIDAALKEIDRLISAEGEKPELLLLKARALESQRDEEATAKLLSEFEEKKDKPADQSTQPAQSPKTTQAQPTVDRTVELLKRITARWPDFAPAQLMLGRQLLRTTTDDALAPLSNDSEAAIAALRRYALLVPEDPRPWRDLANAFEQTEKFDEAEKAYRTAIQRDGTYLEHHAMLVNFLLDHEELEKAKTAFTQMLKAAPDKDEAFEYLNDEEGFDADTAKSREQLLQAFPKEVAASKSALLLLADLQEAQHKIADAIKSVQQAIAIEADADDYETLSRLYRQQRRFTEALNAANQALKLDDSALYIHFERACSLAQLGRKREALAALKQMTEDGKPLFFDVDEPDLQPLATTPEFKALKEKMKEPMTPSKEKEDKPGKPAEKTNNGNL